MLMEHETIKLKELEEMYGRELKEWRSQLKPRKQVSINFNFFSFSFHYFLNQLKKK